MSDCNPETMVTELQNKMDNFINELETKKPTYVSYEMFKQALELNTENLRQLYSMLHDLIMEKTFVVDVDMGGIKFIVSGNNDNTDNVIEAANKMVDKLTKKFYTKGELDRMVKNQKRNDSDVKKGYN